MDLKARAVGPGAREHFDSDLKCNTIDPGPPKKRPSIERTRLGRMPVAGLASPPPIPTHEAINTASLQHRPDGMHETISENVGTCVAHIYTALISQHMME